MNLIDSKLREKISQSYNGGHLSCQSLLSLLDNKVSPGAIPARNKLIKLLADARSHSNRAAHNVNSNDSTMHYTIFVDGRGFHLRLDRRGIIFQITDNARRDVGTIPPWVGPGAAS